MEKKHWIENVLSSTNGMSQVNPSDDLLAKIHQKIKQQEYATPTTVWLVAASIAVLFLLNIALLNGKTNQNQNTATVYLENTLNQSNQLY